MDVFQPKLHGEDRTTANSSEQAGADLASRSREQSSKNSKTSPKHVESKDIVPPPTVDAPSIERRSQHTPASPSVDDRSRDLTKDFEAWYVKAITEHYGNELDKVRQAQDFKASSIPILAHTLRQGTRLFSDKDKEIVLGGRKKV